MKSTDAAFVVRSIKDVTLWLFLWPMRYSEMKKVIGNMRIRLSVAFLFVLLNGIPCVSGQARSGAPPCPDQSSPVSENFGGNPSAAAWNICWDTSDQGGLIIKSVSVLPPGKNSWLSVLNEARIAEIYVPYDDASTNFFDISGFRFPLLSLKQQDCVGGQILERPNSKDQVCRQTLDRDLAWRQDSAFRRGKELQIWAVLKADNYNYIQRWSFLDDGSIVGAIGATGKNLAGSFYVSHNHVITWKLDVAFNNNSHNSAKMIRHDQRSSPEQDSFEDLSREGSIDLDPLKFEALSFFDTALLDGNGRGPSYYLVPKRYGNYRDGQPEYANHDIWITRAHPGENKAIELTTYANTETVSNADIVVWYTSSMHHIPRLEDGIIMAGNPIGATQLMWVTVDLMPHDVLGQSPLYP